MLYGGHSPVYSGGCDTHLILKVKPENKEIPIHTLTFQGFSIVKGEDYICAKNPAYEEHSIPQETQKSIYRKRVQT